MRKVWVRGLCRESIFDKEYIYNIREDGSPIFIGVHTSSVIYDYSVKLWTWLDRVDNKSVATSANMEARLLLGLNKFSMKGVVGDKCTDGKDDKNVIIKFTTCVAGMFTCADGQCIDIEERCDQTPNCVDESDEDGCKMLVQKDNYNKKIAPFKFDKEQGGIVPVNVNVSIALRDILSIQEVNHVFTPKFRFTMEWYDYRIIYHNLKVHLIK